MPLLVTAPRTAVERLRRLPRALTPRGRRRARLLRRMPQHAQCAELGVWKGNFAQDILDLTRPRRLHLVDPWRFRPEFPHRMYGGKVARDQSDMDRIYESVKRRFRARPEVRIHRCASSELSGRLDSESLDWVYIDGDHSEAAVYQDLAMCARLVRPGGILTGDDYDWHDADGSPSVKRAVNRFAREHDLPVEHLGAGQFMLPRP
jgi:hypothetical protein